MEANYVLLKNYCQAKNVQLIAVSKKQSVEKIKCLYDLGQRDFAENYVQELLIKQPLLPADIRWHCIGHLQRNKVKYIVPFVDMIQSVDSIDLLKEIQKQAMKAQRKIKVLLQVHIANEATKFGLQTEALFSLLQTYKQLLPIFSSVSMQGLMGMASFVADTRQITEEFSILRALFEKCKKEYFFENSDFSLCSMGMSGDYKIAVENGSNLIRVGSLLFGERR